MSRRLLFVMLHPGFIRYFEGALHALAAAGHQVHVAFEISRSKLGEDLTALRLASSSPLITCGTTPERRESVRDFLSRGDRRAVRSGGRIAAGSWAEARVDAWESLATTIRLMQDYLRFFEPAFAGAPALRARAEKRVPRVPRGLVRAAARTGPSGRRALASALHSAERLIPVNPAIESFLRAQRPDVLLITPLVELGSQQVDYIKCARALGIPSVLCVASWDNLTSKGLMRVVPDHVIVWNEAQRTEAVALHGVASGRVTVTGAHLFDRWFEARPSRSREEFCGMAGLDPQRPFVLYVGSSTFIAPDEVPFVERWIGWLRAAADARVATAGVLVRPHPANSRQWLTFDRTAFPGVALWPPVGTDPNHPDFWRDYYDSLYHCAAVVGVNTSAQIEAAVVGRPVLTVRAPEFRHAQDGTLHFQHLVDEGGFVRLASSFEEHLSQLAEALSCDSHSEASRRFVAAFVRPHGLDRPAATLFAAAIARIADEPRPVPTPPSPVAAILRPVALTAAFAVRLLAEDRPLWVYAMRPVLRAGVYVWSTVHRAEVAIERARAKERRLRRAVWRVWYESRRQLRSRLRHGIKPVRRAVRQAGHAAWRAVRRQV